MDPSITELEELRALRIELISQNNQIKQRLLTLEKENKLFKDKFAKLSETKRNDDEMSNINKAQYSKEKNADQEQIEELKADKRKLEATIDKLHIYQKDHEKELEEQFYKQIEELEKEKEELNEKLDLCSKYMDEREQRAEEIASLRKKCEDEKKLRLEQVNEKERDRIKETEQLRKEMLQSIKKTKANLLALNDEQLQTTTRLTILQNH